MTKRKLSDTEEELLRIVWNHGGETTEEVIASEMRMVPRWMRVYLVRLGRADLIDVDRSGRVKLTGKGSRKLEVPDRRPTLPDREHRLY